MTTQKKNQHYLPKFYLRNFSCNLDGKRIGLFNINNQFYVDLAPIKSQCSKNFFYGSDGIVEDWLSDIEGILAPIIKEILNTQILPVKNSLSHKYLAAFVILTQLRNPSQIESAIKTTDEMNKKTLQLHPNVKKESLLPQTTQIEAIRSVLSKVPMGVDNILDLEYKLLINKTPIPFITSDLPVVQYNQFLEKKKWQHGRTGFAKIGLQIFIPLSPKIGIIFYDSTVYRVGNNRDKFLLISQTDDMNKLNTLQFVNCIDTVYFNENLSKHQISTLYEGSKKYAKANKTISSIEKVINSDGSIRDLIVIGTSDCNTQLEILGIRISSRGKSIKLKSDMAQYRTSSNAFKNKTKKSRGH